MNESSFNFGNFVWWIGKAVDIYDKSKFGRIKTRIFGYYGDEIPDNDLPWASVISPIQGASHGQIGHSPTGIQIGSVLFGFFMDGESAQIPVILGTFHGEGDIHRYATGGTGKSGKSVSSKSGKSFSVPGSGANPKYPHNHVIAGENGVIIEWDNTPGYQRYAWEHPAGTFFEVHPNGKQVNSIAEDSYKSVAGNDHVYISGDATVFIGGNAKVVIDGNLDEHIMGNRKTTIDGDDTTVVGGRKKVSVNGYGGYSVSVKYNYKVSAKRIDLN